MTHCPKDLLITGPISDRFNHIEAQAFTTRVLEDLSRFKPQPRFFCAPMIISLLSHFFLVAPAGMHSLQDFVTEIPSTLGILILPSLHKNWWLPWFILYQSPASWTWNSEYSWAISDYGGWALELTGREGTLTVSVHEAVLLSENMGHRKWHFHSFKKVFVFPSPPPSPLLLSLSFSQFHGRYLGSHACQPRTLQLSSMAGPAFPHLALFSHRMRDKS